MMKETALDYLAHMYTYESVANVLAVEGDSTGHAVLVLDRTIFYPQGGGQPSDAGTVQGDDLSFQVTHVTFSSGFVRHTGRVLQGRASPGQSVTLRVDEERRAYHSKLHTAGHLLFTAMQTAGPGLVATKGYHFPDGPYVEFDGLIPEAERPAVATTLQAEADRLIAEDLAVIPRLVSMDELRRIYHPIPPDIPTDKPTRVVSIDGFHPPCGGTHVRSLADIKGTTVRGVKSRSGHTRVSYSVPS